MTPIGVLVSGRGSNLEAILRSSKAGEIPKGRVSVVISNDHTARALSVAELNGVKATVVSDQGIPRDKYGDLLSEALRGHGVTPETGLVVLAGFMKILSRKFVEEYNGRILNIHPSLLPAFPGVRAQKQALERGVKVSGCTVHFVVPEVDAGPIVAQRAVRVKEGDDEETLSARILREEHKVLPMCIRLFTDGKLTLSGGRVKVS